VDDINQGEGGGEEGMGEVWGKRGKRGGGSRGEKGGVVEIGKTRVVSLWRVRRREWWGRVLEMSGLKLMKGGGGRGREGRGGGRRGGGRGGGKAEGRFENWKRRFDGRGVSWRTGGEKVWGVWGNRGEVCEKGGRQEAEASQGMGGGGGEGEGAEGNSRAGGVRARREEGATKCMGGGRVGGETGDKVKQVR